MAWQSSCRLLPAQKPTLQHAWQVAPCSCACPSQRLRSGAGANTAGRSGWGTPVSKTLRSGHAGGRWACAHASCLLLRSALQSSAWQLPVPRHRLPLAGLPPYRQDDPEPSRPDMCLAATGCGLPLLAPCRRPPKPAGTLYMLDKVIKTGSLHGSSCQSPDAAYSSPHSLAQALAKQGSAPLHLHKQRALRECGCCAILQLACKDVWQLPVLCYGVLPDSRVKVWRGIPA